MIEVYFDSNKFAIQSNNVTLSTLENKALSRELLGLKSFLESNKITDKVKIFTTDIVIEESKKRLKNIAIDKVTSLKSHLNNASIDISHEKLTDDYWWSKIEDNLQKELKENNIEVIKSSAKIKVEDLINRSLNHDAPFEKDGDKGFKDTIIFLTILQKISEEVNKPDQVILITGDGRIKDCMEEFKDKTGVELIVSDGNDIDDILDTQLNLNIGISKIRDDFNQYMDIEKNQEYAEAKVLSLIRKKTPKKSHFVVYINENWMEKVMDINFKNFEITKIDSKDKKDFEIKLETIFEVYYAEKPKMKSLFEYQSFEEVPRLNSTLPDNIKQKFIIKYNKESGSFGDLEISGDPSAVQLFSGYDNFYIA